MLDELARARRRETAARLTGLLDLVAEGVLTAEDVLSDSGAAGPRKEPPVFNSRRSAGIESSARRGDHTP